MVSFKYTLLSILAMALVVTTGFICLSNSSVSSADLPKTYFKFTIPTNADGTVVAYSPGWFGTLNEPCPKDVTVLLYNDSERYGIAYTTDKVTQKGLTVISEAIAESVVNPSLSRNSKGTFSGTKLRDRWLPEVKTETREYKIELGKEIPVDSKTTFSEVYDPSERVSKTVVVCPVCNSILRSTTKDLTAYRDILTCPYGHRSVTKLDE